MNKKVKMILTNSFKNDIRVFKEAKTLANNGYDVEVLCWDRENELLDKEYDNVEGIKVKRFYPFSKYGTGKKQIIPFIKFIFQVKKYLKNKKIDIIHCHDLDGLVTGYFIKSKKQKMIYDSHEFFSGYKGLYINKKIFYMEKFLLKKVDNIIMVSKIVCQEFQKLYKIKQEPILLRNIPYYEKIDKKNNLLRKEFNISEDKKILLYQGGFQRGRGIEDLILLLKNLSEKFVLILIGKGPLKEKILELVEKNNLKDRVFIKNFIENKELIRYTNSADIGIYFIPKLTFNHLYCLPNKIFEFVQGEIPIVCSNFPDIKNLIISYNLGITFDSIIECKENELLRLLETKKDIVKVKKELCWETEEKKLLNLYQNL